MRKLSPRGPKCFRCLILMLSGPVELLFLLFLICNLMSLYISGVKFAYVSVDYSVCSACCACFVCDPISNLVVPSLCLFCGDV